MSSLSVTVHLRRMRVLGLALAALLIGAASASAHDFWIVPDAFRVAVSNGLTVRTVTGIKFPSSESPVTPERIADARIVAPVTSGDEPLRDFTVSGKSLLIRHRPATDGQRVIALALVPATRRMTSDAFARYLRLEGAPDLADRYARGKPSSQDSIVMRSTKYAKTLVNVGMGGPLAFTRTAGHQLELVPLRDPLAIRAGETLAVQVLASGRPLADALIHAGRAAREGEAPTTDLTLTADSKGVVRLPVTSAGLWNLRTAHTVPAAGAATVPATWDVWWATFVFATADAGSTPSAGAVTPVTPRPSGGDSTDVMRVVEGFHAALARGDSTAMLALLAPDVLILESGDVERLADYRSHHLPADIAFARAVPATHSVVGARVETNTGWVTSTSTARGQVNGRTINSVGAESMVVTRSAAGSPWTIRAIHWSSHQGAR